MKKLFFFCILFLSGCASTQIDSLINPKYENTYFQNILIVCDIKSLVYRTKIEDYLADDLSDLKVSAKVTPESDLAFQVHALTLQKVDELARSQKCDAILFISLYNPQTNTTDINGPIEESGSISQGYYGSYKFKSSTSQFHLTLTETTVNGEIDLMTTDKKALAWHGEALVSSGKLFGSVDGMIESFTDTLAQEIKNSGILDE
jgi:hypothetical protein